MPRIFRRHSKDCAKGYAELEKKTDCTCIFQIEGTFGKKFIRKSLNTRSLETAKEILERAVHDDYWPHREVAVDRICSDIDDCVKPFGTAANGRRGKASEYLVVADLLCRGYEVLIPANPNTPYDLVAMDGKEITRIEVKTGRHKKAVRVEMDAKRGNIDVVAVVSGDSGQIEYYPLVDEDHFARTLVVRSGAEKIKRLYAKARAEMEASGKLLDMAG